MIAKTLFFGDPKAKTQLVQLTGGDEEGFLSSEFGKIRELSGAKEWWKQYYAIALLKKNPSIANFEIEERMANSEDEAVKAAYAEFRKYQVLNDPSRKHCNKGKEPLHHHQHAGAPFQALPMFSRFPPHH